jgi:protein O-GlcNAc transferase
MDIPSLFQKATGLHQSGRLDEAEVIYRQILHREPHHMVCVQMLGMLAVQKGRFEEGISLCARVLKTAPNSASFFNSYGVALQATGKLEPAIEAFRQAIKLQLDYSYAMNNLCNCLHEAGRVTEAIAAGREAIRLHPESAVAYNNLGIALADKEFFDEAIAAFRRAISLQPDLAQAHYNLGRGLKELGELDEALAEYRRAIELAPDMTEAYDSVAYVSCVHPNYEVKMNLEDCRLWSRQFEEPLKKEWKPRGVDRSSDRRLRVGYVSPDFGNHPVGRFMLPLLREHDRERVEVFCYSALAKPDELTQRMRGFADCWRDVSAESDEKLAEIVRGDRIDILVDLTMHMANNRLKVFARKPAPLQATYLAYAGTTGLEAIDYRISDPWLDPAGGREDGYSEKTIRLAKCYWCYEAPTEAMESGPLPADRAGHVTFGAFNTFAKVSPGTLEAWAKILAATARSRLILNAPNGSVRERVARVFGKHGVTSDRIEYVGIVPMTEYFARYLKVDIALDPFPYVGGTTTCDALWMGVPVVTLRGKTAISRGGASIMNNVGVPELVAESVEDYVKKAVMWADDRERLRRFRAEMRKQMRGSALMDAKRFARDIEEVFGRMWERAV